MHGGGSEFMGEELSQWLLCIEQDVKMSVQMHCPEVLCFLPHLMELVKVKPNPVR